MGLKQKEIKIAFLIPPFRVWGGTLYSPIIINGIHLSKRMCRKMGKMRFGARLRGEPQPEVRESCVHLLTAETKAMSG